MKVSILYKDGQSEGFMHSMKIYNSLVAARKYFCDDFKSSLATKRGTEKVRFEQVNANASKLGASCLVLQNLNLKANKIRLKMFDVWVREFYSCLGEGPSCLVELHGAVNITEAEASFSDDQTKLKWHLGQEGRMQDISPGFNNRDA